MARKILSISSKLMLILSLNRLWPPKTFKKIQPEAPKEEVAKPAAPKPEQAAEAPASEAPKVVAQPTAPQSEAPRANA